MERGGYRHRLGYHTSKDYRPPRLAITPTIRHYVPASSPAGGRSLFGWLSTKGDRQLHEPPLCKGRWLPVGQTEGLYVTITAKYNPSVSYADSASGPVVQSSQSALTVPSARFTPHLRVALHFVQVPTGHALPSGALHRGAFAGGHSSRLPAKPLVTCLLS